MLLTLHSCAHNRLPSPDCVTKGTLGTEIGLVNGVASADRPTKESPRS